MHLHKQFILYSDIKNVMKIYACLGMLPRGRWLTSQLLSHGCSSRPDLQISNQCSLTELLPEFALRIKTTTTTTKSPVKTELRILRNKQITQHYVTLSAASWGSFTVKTVTKEIQTEMRSGGWIILTHLTAPQDAQKVKTPPSCLDDKAKSDVRR